MEKSEKKNKYSKSIGLVVIIILVLIINRVIKNEGSNLSKPPPTLTAVNSSTVTLTIEPEPTKNIVPSIPGLAPADIIVNLENKDFECTNVKTVKTENMPDSFLWYCDREDGSITYNVEFSSYSLKTVDSIDASVMQTLYESTELAEPFLSWFSTVAFLEDSTAQAEIKKWVSSSILNWNETQKTITKKGVNFTLSGSEFYMLLTIETP